MAQARQNTKDSQESSKSRNAGIIEPTSNNGMLNYQNQLNINENNVYSQNQTMSDQGHSPYKGYNKNRISAKLRNNEATNSRNNAQNRLNVIPGESNTVDQMPKKNSFIMMNHNANRGSQGGADGLVFKNAPGGTVQNLSGIHNRTTSVFNNNSTKNDFGNKKSVGKKVDNNKKASDYIASINQQKTKLR